MTINYDNDSISLKRIGVLLGILISLLTIFTPIVVIGSKAAESNKDYAVRYQNIDNRVTNIEKSIEGDPEFKQEVLRSLTEIQTTMKFLNRTPGARGE